MYINFIYKTYNFVTTVFFFEYKLMKCVLMSNYTLEKNIITKHAL